MVGKANEIENLIPKHVICLQQRYKFSHVAEARSLPILSLRVYEHARVVSVEYVD
jgi:hypothetical protein